MLVHRCHRLSPRLGGAAVVAGLHGVVLSIALSIETRPAPGPTPRPVEVKLLDAPKPRPAEPVLATVAFAPRAPAPLDLPALPEIAIERLPLTINTQPIAAARKETPDAESGAVGARADKASEAAAELVQLRDIEFERFEPPPYPPLSRRLGEQGVVVVRVQVDEQGSPVAVAVHVSSGFARLDEAALRAVRAARFRPYMQGTRARAAYALVPIRFVLS